MGEIQPVRSRAGSRSLYRRRPAKTTGRALEPALRDGESRTVFDGRRAFPSVRRFPVVFRSDGAGTVFEVARGRRLKTLGESGV